MKDLFMLFLLCSSNYCFAELHDYPILRVIDGDTVVFQATFLPKELKPELSLRVYGVDTPEKGARAKCKEEADKGEEATAFTKLAIENSTKREIELRQWDKFGGRVLGDLYLDGNSLRSMLIEAKLAREYYGEKKESWCN